MLTVLCGTVLSAVYIVCSEPVVGLFIDDPEVVAYGGPMLIATSLAEMCIRDSPTAAQKFNGRRL